MFFPDKIKNNDVDKNKNYVAQYCVKCDTVSMRLPKKLYNHCRECNICISGYDHHCVFFGKCIGQGNVIYFYGTIGMFFLNIIINVVMAYMKKEEAWNYFSELHKWHTGQDQIPKILTKDSNWEGSLIWIR